MFTSLLSQHEAISFTTVPVLSSTIQVKHHFTATVSDLVKEACLGDKQATFALFSF